MAYRHLILEVYFGYEEGIKNKKPNYCKYNIGNPGYHCFENECKFVSYTECPNEFAYAGEVGEIKGEDSQIGFCGKMEPEPYSEFEKRELLKIWEEICKRKINEAYDEYMELKKMKKM